ncbi:MAG: UDP-glucose/GDP-mannose dehydrogenase family protein [candidate division KSB1 bacterium]|nr:UDP-glucose/GDP-mannose dehydrogenase family protein [candidate division KSB1 bacterium]MDZ7347136.1 UDP-glucose/GDP-mannose dehydrogenase family protein [candidate division KSB1 bacterium]
MNISIVGLGYVGCVSAACLAEMGHQVIGVDNNAGKVRLISQGISPIVEDRIGDLIKEQVGCGRLRATTDLRAAVQASEVVFVCVGTPSAADGTIDFRQVERAAMEIGAALKAKKEYTSVVLRSTVLPGIAENIAVPLLEQFSGKKIGEDFGFALNPEFLREGTAVYDFYHPPKTVIGPLDDRTEERLRQIYAAIDAPFFCIGMSEASMIKYADNAFHAVKVAFANEIGRLCKKFNIDARVVMDVFVKDTKLNLSPVYLRPGFAFGGSCLPKDLRAITRHARQADVKVPLLQAALESNEEHIRFAAEMVKKENSRRVGILGISFKEGTDDLRESPVVELARRLLEEGYTLRIFDRNVLAAKRNGSNVDTIKRNFPDLEKSLADSLNEVLEESDVVVIGNRNKEHEAVVGELKNGHRIVDLSGLENAVRENLDEVNYEGICW